MSSKRRKRWRRPGFSGPRSFLQRFAVRYDFDIGEFRRKRQRGPDFRIPYLSARLHGAGPYVVIPAGSPARAREILLWLQEVTEYFVPEEIKPWLSEADLADFFEVELRGNRDGRPIVGTPPEETWERLDRRYGDGED